MQDLLDRPLKVGDMVLNLTGNKMIDRTQFGIVISDDKIIRSVCENGWKVESVWRCLLQDRNSKETEEVYQTLVKAYNSYVQHSIVGMQNYAMLCIGDTFRIKEKEYVYLGKIELSINRLDRGSAFDCHFGYATNGEASIAMKQVKQYNLLKEDNSLDINRMFRLLAIARERFYILHDRNWRKKGPYLTVTQKLRPDAILEDKYKIDTDLYEVGHMVDLSDLGLCENKIDYTDVRYSVKIRSLNNRNMEVTESEA